MRKVRNAMKNRVLVTLFAVTIIWFSLATAFANNASMQSTLYQEEIFFYTNVRPNYAAIGTHVPEKPGVA
jgi:hypothetical protein